MADPDAMNIDVPAEQNTSNKKPSRVTAPTPISVSKNPALASPVSTGSQAGESEQEEPGNSRRRSGRQRNLSRKQLQALGKKHEDEFFETPYTPGSDSSPSTPKASNKKASAGGASTKSAASRKKGVQRQTPLLRARGRKSTTSSGRRASTAQQSDRVVDVEAEEESPQQDDKDGDERQTAFTPVSNRRSKYKGVSGLKKATMPSSNAQKRVKGKRIERPFIIGSEAWPLTAANRSSSTPADHTKGWRVYVRVPDGQPDMTRWLKKVNFKIFHTYPSPLRTVETAPFQIEETGWGGFSIDVRLFFAPEAGAKPEYRQHFLQLEPYGDEETQERQRKEGLVRSEFLDYVEFNEPTEALWDALTDESQFSSNITKSQGAKGGKKGKSRQGVPEPPVNHGAGGLAAEKGTVELADKGSEGNPWSKESEKEVRGVLEEANREVLKQLEVIRGEMEAKTKTLNELKKKAAGVGGGGDGEEGKENGVEGG